MTVFCPAFYPALSTSKVFKIMLLALFILLCVGIFGVLGGVAHGAEVAEFTDTMLQNFKTKFASYENKIWQASLALFGLLFLCQFAWSVGQLFLQESLSFVAVVSTVARQVMTGMFFYWLIFDRSILQGIVGSFSQLAQSGLTLTELIFLMETAVLNIMKAVGESSGVIAGLALFFTGLVACVILSFSLTTAIAYMAIVTLENYIVGSLGLILMGFAGSEYTRSYALSYIRALVHIGFKLFLSTIIVQVGVIAFTQATMGLSGAGNEAISQACMRLIAQSFFFLAIVKIIPEIANTLIGGGSAASSGTAGSIVGGAARAAGAAGAVGGAVAGAYNTPGAIADGLKSAGSSVKNAANAYSSRFNASKASGSGTIRAGASAFGGTLWSAYQASRHGTDIGSEGGNTMTAANTGARGTQPTAFPSPSGADFKSGSFGSGRPSVPDASSASFVSISGASDPTKTSDANSARAAANVGSGERQSPPGTTDMSNASSGTASSGTNSGGMSNVLSSSGKAKQSDISDEKRNETPGSPEELSKKFKTWD